MPIHSSLGDADDRFGKSLRGFLREVVTNATRDGPVLVSARKFLRVGTGLRMWCAIGITFKRNGRHRDDGTLGKPLFQVVVFRLTFCLAESPAIVVDHDGDMIGVVKGGCGTVKRGIIEGPFRRS